MSIVVKNLTHIYNEGMPFSSKALDNISFEVMDGEFLSILGPSGCGKTTLLNIIGGLDCYTSGDLIINGKSTKNFKNNILNTIDVAIPTMHGTNGEDGLTYYLHIISKKFTIYC